MRAPRLAFAAALCLLLLFSACGDSGEHDPSRTTGSSTSTPEPAAERKPLPDPAAFASRFAVFAGERESADELPRGLIPRQVSNAFGLDLEASRLSRDYEGEPLFLVPAPGLICMYTQSEAVGSCWPPRILREGRAVASILCGPALGRGQVSTFGIVPDGIREVTVVRSNVPDVTVPVHGNVFAALSSSKPPLPVAVSWVENGERVFRSSGIPPRVAREGCEAPPPPPTSPSAGSAAR